MTGYYNSEESTKKTIREDGWLFTGDAGVMDARGYIKITGRLKDMIIRGGMNIYPREIEEVLFNHPAINQASVIGIPDPYWGEVIAALLILEKDAEEVSFEELFAHCRVHLSPHKSPIKWAFVDEFPLTPSGKVQKFALRDAVSKGLLSLHDIDKKSASKI